MDTLGFLRAVLPHEGTYYLVLIERATLRPRHKAFTSLEAMAKAIEQLDHDPDHSLYHACASYKSRFIEAPDPKKPGELKRQFRVSENWDRAKAFWLDIDCGHEKAINRKGYPTKRDAYEAVRGFCRKHDLPIPMVVDSGGGLHCYWTLTKPVRPPAWRTMAEVLKRVLAEEKILADPSRTADFASVLRPVGSTNRKKEEERPVHVKRETEPIDPEVFLAKLKVAVEKLAIQLTPKPSAVGGLNDDLITHATNSGGVLEASAKVAAEHCAQIRFMRDTQGDVGYEHWRGVLGIIKHSVEQLPLAFEWSARRAETGHSQIDVETKYDSWSTGPTTCQFFETHNPGGCDGCPHRDKIKTPLVLGRIVPTSPPPAAGAPAPPTLPDGYAYTGGRMTRFLPDKEGVLQALPFSQTLFYPIRRVRDDTGDYSMVFRAHQPRGKTIEFHVSNAVLGSLTDTLKILSQKAEITLTNNRDAGAHLTAYMRDSLERLKREADEVNMMSTFGWKFDTEAFLVGDRLYHRDGTTRRVLLSGYAASIATWFPDPKGTLAGYAEPLDFIYNRTGMEPMQYAIAAGYGSVLTKLVGDEYHGLLLALTGGRTGRGKTTACKAALAGWGDPEKLNSGSSATENGRWSLVGALNDLPILFDEITNFKPVELSKLAYSMANGSDKIRLRAARNEGLRMADQNHWNLSAYATANKDLLAVLASREANTSAEAVRIIQISVDRYNIPTLNPSKVYEALQQMNRNCGVAGEAFIRHVLSKLGEVIERLNDMRQRLETEIPEPDYRKYRHHAACTLVAAQLMQECGVARFDSERLFDFTLDMLKDLCGQVREISSLSPEDAFSRMLAELTPRILRTFEFRDARKGGNEEPENVVHGPVAGRLIKGSEQTKDNFWNRKLLLVKSELRDWCTANRVEPKSLIDWAEENRLLVPLSHDRQTITRGTTLPANNQRVYVFDMEKYERMVGTVPDLRLVSSSDEPVASEAS